MNPVINFHVDPKSLGFTGEGLHRPECILAEKDGTLWCADARGGVVQILSNGEQKLILQFIEKHRSDRIRHGNGPHLRSLPNGLAMGKNGEILIADFGRGELRSMTRGGFMRVMCDSIAGEPLGKVNFVIRDSLDRLWLSVSTRMKEWWKAMSPDVADGYIALCDKGQWRIVADHLRFANEIRLDEQEQYLYAVETAGQCISRMKVNPHGNLFDRETFGPAKLGKAAFPDGIAFDAFGNLWGTLVMTDQVFVLTPEGDFLVVLSDDNSEASSAFAEAFHESRVSPADLGMVGGTIAPCFSSVTFGGVDLKTVYIGSVKGTRIPFFRSPVSGLPMAHWARSEA